MLQSIKSNLLDGMLVGLSLSLIYNRATWPAAIVIVAIIAARGFEKYLATKKVEDNTTDLREKMASMENKLALLGMSKRG